VDPDAIDAVTRVPHGGESDPELVEFSANTNPQTPDGVAGVYEAALSAAGRYPTDDYCEFRAAAADYIGVTVTEIIPTAGGLAGMRLLCSVVIANGDSVAIPTPSFGEYAREVRLHGGEPAFVGPVSTPSASGCDTAWPSGFGSPPPRPRFCSVRHTTRSTRWSQKPARQGLPSAMRRRSAGLTHISASR